MLRICFYNDVRKSEYRPKKNQIPVFAYVLPFTFWHLKVIINMTLLFSGALYLYRYKEVASRGAGTQACVCKREKLRVRFPIKYLIFSFSSIW